MKTSYGPYGRYRKTSYATNSGSSPPIPPEGTLQAAALPSRANFTGTVVSSGLQVDINFEAGSITLGGTMRSSGSTPPVVQLLAGTGSLTFNGDLCPGFWIDILPGALTFDLSFNSGITVAFSGQTIPVGGGNYVIPSGTYAGMIINFPLGVYNSNNLYEGVIESLVSSEGNLRVFSQATTARQPVFRHRDANPDGKNAMFCISGGVGQYLVCTTPAVAFTFKNDPPLTVFGRTAYTSSDFNGMWLSAADLSSNDINQRAFGQSSNSTGREYHFVINSAATLINNLGSTTPPTGGTGAHTVCWYFPGSNGGANIEVNASPQSLVSSALNIGANDPTNVCIGSIADNAPSIAMGGYIYRIVWFNTQLSEAARDAWNADIAA